MAAGSVEIPLERESVLVSRAGAQGFEPRLKGRTCRAAVTPRPVSQATEDRGGLGRNDRTENEAPAHAARLPPPPAFGVPNEPRRTGVSIEQGGFVTEVEEAGLSKPSFFSAALSTRRHRSANGGGGGSVTLADFGTFDRKHRTVGSPAILGAQVPSSSRSAPPLCTPGTISATRPGPTLVLGRAVRPISRSQDERPSPARSRSNFTPTRPERRIPRRDRVRRSRLRAVVGEQTRCDLLVEALIVPDPRRPVRSEPPAAADHFPATSRVRPGPGLEH